MFMPSPKMQLSGANVPVSLTYGKATGTCCSPTDTPYLRTKEAFTNTVTCSHTPR